MWPGADVLGAIRVAMGATCLPLSWLLLRRADQGRDPLTVFAFNSFISITPSKPLMLSGSWLTPHNCEIYYLAAVNCHPAITDLIFIRVNIYPWPGEGGLQLISEPVYFIRVTIYPAAFPHNISRGHFLPGGGGRRRTANILTCLFYQGHYFVPCDLIPQY